MSVPFKLYLRQNKYGFFPKFLYCRKHKKRHRVIESFGKYFGHCPSSKLKYCLMLLPARKSF